MLAKSIERKYAEYKRYTAPIIIVKLVAWFLFSCYTVSCQPLDIR